MSESKEFNKMRIEAKNLFYNHSDKYATYNELYKHLEEKGYSLNKGLGNYDINVVLIFNEITQANLTQAQFNLLHNPNDPAYINSVANGGYDAIKLKVEKSYKMTDASLLAYQSYLDKMKLKEDKEKREQKERDA